MGLFWLLPKEKDHRADLKLDGTYKGNKDWMSTHRLRPGCTVVQVPEWPLSCSLK